MLEGKSLSALNTNLRIIFIAGLILNSSTGVIIIVTCYKNKDSNPANDAKYWRDWLNLVAAAVSNIMLVDALRRLRKIVKGVFTVDTW